MTNEEKKEVARRFAYGGHLAHIAIQIINTLPKHEKLINFWPLWEKTINDIK